MIGFNGGLIGKANPTIAAASIPGVWTPREVEVAVRNAKWSNAGLLDIYAGATAAFSLRSLRGATTNSAVVQVRRSSDSALSDFTATQITDGSLVAWVGAGNNGFVRTWYDQSGNGNNATQATDGSQPRIVVSGVLERDPADTGRPTIRFGLVTSRLVTPTIAITSNCAIFAVTKHTNSTSTWSFFFGHTQSGARFYVGKAANGSGSPAVHLKFAGGDFSTFTGTDMIAKTVSYWQQGAGISQYRLNNGTTTALTSGSTTSVGISIGGPGVDNTDNPWYGPIQEFIYYPTSQVNTHANIMTDINAYYSIY